MKYSTQILQRTGGALRPPPGLVRQVYHRALAFASYTLLRRIEAEERRLKRLNKGDEWDKAEAEEGLTRLRQIKAACTQRADRTSRYRLKPDLSRWMYRDSGYKPEPIYLELSDSPIGGVWEVESRTLSMGVRLRYAKYDSDVRSLYTHVEHEVAHIAQTILKNMKGLSEEGGLPPRKNRLTDSVDGIGYDHGLKDIEYHPRLLDAIAEFQALRVPEAYRKTALQVFVGQGTAQRVDGIFVQRNTFLDALKSGNRKNWKRAVGVLVGKFLP